MFVVLPYLLFRLFNQVFFFFSFSFSTLFHHFSNSIESCLIVSGRQRGQVIGLGAFSKLLCGLV